LNVVALLLLPDFQFPQNQSRLNYIIDNMSCQSCRLSPALQERANQRPLINSLFWPQEY